MKAAVSVELTSDDFENAMRVLRAQYGQTFVGLQSSIVGQCMQGRSLPKFAPAGRR